MLFAARFFAQYINYLLVTLLLLLPLLQNKDDWRSRGEFWLRSALGIGLAVILAESGKHFVVLPGNPGFPSGHETFGLAAATSLALRDPTWLPNCLLLTGLLAWALITAHYHQPVDVAGALLIGPPSALLCQWAGRRNTET